MGDLEGWTTALSGCCGVWKGGMEAYIQHDTTKRKKKNDDDDDDDDDDDEEDGFDARLFYQKSISHERHGTA